MRVLDLFSGIGGFRIGLEAAGHETVGWVEIDKYARKSYEAIHQPEGEWTHDDIRTVDYRELPRADIWTFGFPCQDISVAGNQAGFSGNRSSLFFAVTKRLRQIKEWDSSRMPSYLLIENVKNFLSVNDGWDFLLAQVELDEIGYDCEWQVLNSKDFGVPQHRERVFIVGHLRGRSTRKVFPIRRESTAVDCKLADRPESKILVTKKGDQLVKRDIVTCLDANYAKGLDNHQARTGVLEIRPVLTPDREKIRQNGRRMKDPGEPMFTLTAQDKHGIAIIDDQGRTNKQHKLKSICPTLRAQTHGNEPKVTDGYKIRKLTPRETWRLQGFPDWAFDRARDAGVSDSQLYKQSGNSVTTTVIYEIAKQLGVDEA